MIMLVPCTIKFYQIIFLLLPLQDGQRKYVTRFVCKLLVFFSPSFLLPEAWWFGFFPCLSAVFWWLNYPLRRRLFPTCGLWVTREHEFCWEIQLVSAFFSFFLGCLTCSVLCCQVSRYYHLLQVFEDWLVLMEWTFKTKTEAASCFVLLFFFPKFKNEVSSLFLTCILQTLQ